MATAKKSAFFYYGISAGHEQRKLIFSQYVDFLHLVRDVFNHEGIPYQYLDGSTPATDRMKAVDDFQTGQGDFFLISLKARRYGTEFDSRQLCHSDGSVVESGRRTAGRRPCPSNRPNTARDNLS